MCKRFVIEETISDELAALRAAADHADVELLYIQREAYLEELDYYLDGYSMSSSEQYILDAERECIRVGLPMDMHVQFISWMTGFDSFSVACSMNILEAAFLYAELNSGEPPGRLLLANVYDGYLDNFFEGD